MTAWKKNFFLIWTGQAVSSFTSMVLQFAIIWSLTDLTGSGIVLSGAMLAGFLPRALLGPFAGAVIDCYSRKTIMILSDIFIAAACAVLALVDTVGEVPLWMFFAVLVFRSVGAAFHQPCMKAVTPQIVPRDQLARCAGYSQTIQSVSKLLSPAAAAALYGFWGLNQIILMDILGAFLAVLTLLRTRIPRMEKAEFTRPRVVRDTVEGFRILRSNRGMFGLIGVGALYTASLMPVSALFPLMCMSYFGGTSVEAGIVEMVFSAGVLVGALLLSATGGMKNKVHTIFAMALLMSACLFIDGLLPPSGIWVFAAVAFFMGICGPCFWGSQTALLQQSFANEVMGRVMALSESVRVFASPISLAVSGLLTEWFGAPFWFCIGGCMTLLCAILCQAIPSIRNSDRPVAK